MKITEIDMPKQAFIFAAIHLLANRLQTMGDKIDPTISNKKWFVLAAVSKFKEAPPNIGDIAELLGTSRQNIKKIASTLEQRGFLKLEKDKNDLRKIQLFLTERSYNYFKSREQLENNYIDNFFSDIDDKMLDMLYDAMGKLIENLDKMIENGAVEKRQGDK